MKLNQITQVISLAETGSFSESARQLYMSQPNLSQSIKQLESEIGNDIFERLPSGLTLTPFGKEYLTRLYVIQGELDSLDDFCYKKPQNIRLSLNIAAMSCDWINSFFSKVISDYESFQLNFSLYHTESLDTALELLCSSSCDLAVIGLTSRERKEALKKYRSLGIEYHRIFSSPIYIMVGEKNPLYHSAETRTAEEITKYPYVNYGSSKGDMAGSYLSLILGISPHSHSMIRVNNRSALYNVVANTQAFTLSANSMRLPTHPKVRSFPLNDLPDFIEFGYIKLRRTQLSDAAADFVDSVMEIFQKD